MKIDTSLYPWDAVRCNLEGLTLDHVDLLLTAWWTRRTRTDRLELAIPSAWVLPVCEALRDGAIKYAPRDWETNPACWNASRDFSAFKRHYYSPLERDPESGLPHWYHAAARAVMLATLSTRGVLVDDRPPSHLGVGEVDIDLSGLTLTRGGDA